MFASSNHLHTLKTTCWDFRGNSLVSEIIWSAKPLEVKDLVQKQKYQQSNFLHEELIKNKSLHQLRTQGNCQYVEEFKFISSWYFSPSHWSHPQLTALALIPAKTRTGNVRESNSNTGSHQPHRNPCWSFSAQALRDAKAQAQQPGRRVGDNQL